MTIPAPPTAPNPSDPATFDPRAVAWVAWWMAAIPEINALSGMTNSGQFLDGLQTAPSITFTADPDTGIYRATSNQIAIATGGVKRFLISTTACVVDVPISGTAVMANDTDTTAGKLMTVGAFGLGDPAVPPLLAAINATTTASGFYAFTTGATGTFPAGITAAGGGTISVFRESATKGRMILCPSGTTRMFIRALNTTWGAWAEFGAIGYTPVEQGGNAGMDTNKINLGWRTDGLGFQANVDGAYVGMAVANSQTPAGVGVGRNNGTIIAPGAPPLFACRAWVSFEGGAGNRYASGNVSSVVRNALGDFTINFTDAMPDVNYATIGTCSQSGQGTAVEAIHIQTITATAVRVFIKWANSASGGFFDPAFASIAIFR